MKKIVLVFIGVLIVSGCLTSTGNKDIFFKSTDMSISDEPLLNKEVYITLTASNPMIDTNASLEIILPEGFQLVEGDLTWDGFMSKNQSKQLKAKIKAIEEGEWLIIGWAGPSWNKKYDLEDLYASVYEDWASVDKTPKRCLGDIEQVKECLKTTVG